jgi:pimeloyl-ACP methyl ester carboxylesterase
MILALACVSPEKQLLRMAGTVLVAVAFISGCNTPGGESASDASGERVSVGDTEAVVWGEGKKGTVLSHGAAYDAASWEPQGQELGENSVVALAVEDTSPKNLQSAVDFLKEEYGVESVALIGASAGATPMLEVAEEDSEEIDQMILLSGVGEVSGLGEHPKLFVASEGEGISVEVRRMADEAPGERNEALILSGDAHAQAIFQTEEGERLMEVILERLEEYG